MGVPREKMAAYLRRAIQAVLDRGLHDPRTRGMITVTRTEISQDYANANVFVTVMPESRRDIALHGLASAAAHIRAQVSRRAEFRRVPTLHFRTDAVRKREADVLAVIARTTAEDQARADAGKDGFGASVKPSGGAPAEVGEPVADADVLAAFDEFMASTTPGETASADEPSSADGAGTRLDESDEMNDGDRGSRRPEDPAT